MLIGCCGPVEKYRQIANDGYDYFEALGWQIFDLGLEDFMDFVAQTEEVGLPVRRISSYCGASPAIVGPRFDAAAVKAYARAMCVRAQMLGVEQIGIGSPKARQLPEGFDKAEADAQCEQFLTITANEAADYGIGIMLEGVHPGYCNYLNDTGLEGRAFTGEALMYAGLTLPLMRGGYPGVQLLLERVDAEDK